MPDKTYETLIAETKGLSEKARLKKFEEAFAAGELDPNERVSVDPFDNTPTTPILHRLASESDDIFLLYIKNEADVFAKDASGKTALFFVNNQEKFNALLEKSEDAEDYVNMLDHNYKNYMQHHMEVYGRAPYLNKGITQEIEQTKEILRAFAKAGGDMNHRDADGKTLHDYAVGLGNSKSEPLGREIRDLGGKSSSELNEETLERFAANQKNPIQTFKLRTMPISSLPSSDTDSVPTPPPATTYRSPKNLAVVESINPLFDEEGKHIKAVSSVAEAVAKRLGRGVSTSAFDGDVNAGPPSGVFDLDTIPSFAILSRTPAGKSGEIVFSNSEGSGEKTFDDRDIPYSHNPDDSEEKKSYPIVFYGVGNDGELGKNLQNNHYLHQQPRAVPVGAADKIGENTFDIPKYCEQRPFLVAPVITQNGEKIEGTSFSTPYAAAVYSELSARYGKSDAYPHGLSFDEILSAMANTANKNATANGKPITFTAHTKAFSYSDEAGFGVVDAVKADALCPKICTLKEQHKMTDIPLEQEKHLLGEGMVKDGKYIYTVTPHKTLKAQSLYLELNMVGAPEPPQIEVSVGGNAFRVSPGTEGKGTIHGVRGIDMQQGESFTITSNAPLKEGSDLTIRGKEKDDAFDLFVKLEELGNSIKTPSHTDTQTAPKQSPAKAPPKR